MTPSESGRVGDQWRLIVRFVLTHYGVAAGLGLFLSNVALIVMGFLMVQVYSIGIGETSNEACKRNELRDKSASFNRSNMGALRPYNRGWGRNFAEILFPEHFLNQAGLLSSHSTKSKST